jgi:Ca2+:H+ antiporter
MPKEDNFHSSPVYRRSTILSTATCPFALIFQPIELAVFGLAAFLFYLVTEDGEGTWLEGVQLLAFYFIFAGTAFFLK